MTTERPEPVLFHATLEEVKLKRTKDGVVEHTVRLTAYNLDDAELPHLAGLQKELMHVAFAPAPPASSFEGFEPS